MPAKKTTRPTAAAARSTAPRSAARPAAAKAPRARRAKVAAPADVPEVAAETAAARSPEPAPKAAAPRPVTREDIQVRAYFLALEHAGQGGSLDYWLAAERELLQG